MPVSQDPFGLRVLLLRTPAQAPVAGPAPATVTRPRNRHGAPVAPDRLVAGFRPPRAARTPACPRPMTPNPQRRPRAQPSNTASPSRPARPSSSPRGSCSLPGASSTVPPSASERTVIRAPRARVRRNRHRSTRSPRPSTSNSSGANPSASTRRLDAPSFQAVHLEVAVGIRRDLRYPSHRAGHQGAELGRTQIGESSLREPARSRGLTTVPGHPGRGRRHDDPPGRASSPAAPETLQHSPSGHWPP